LSPEHLILLTLQLLQLNNGFFSTHDVVWQQAIDVSECMVPKVDEKSSGLKQMRGWCEKS
jgi:hypothetical protein